MIEHVLPKEGIRLYNDVYSSSYSRTGSDAIASRVAWDITKKRFRKAGQQWIANSKDFTAPSLFVFDLSPMEGHELIVNAEDDEIIVEGILASMQPNKKGKWFTLDALEALARQINEGGSTLPDVEHAVMASLREKFVPQHRLPENITKEKGMFNKIKAAVKDGKLWIKAWLDKKYQEIIELYKFLSIEALGMSNEEGGIEADDYLKYLGFTFTNKPQLPDAQIAGL